MPRDVSSSSSEDEADSPAQKSPVKQKESGKFTHRVEQSCCWAANTQIVELEQIHEARITQKYKTILLIIVFLHG